jgi:hypothetical protein
VRLGRAAAREGAQLRRRHAHGAAALEQHIPARSWPCPTSCWPAC